MSPKTPALNIDKKDLTLLIKLTGEEKTAQAGKGNKSKFRATQELLWKLEDAKKLAYPRKTAK